MYELGSYYEKKLLDIKIPAVSIHNYNKMMYYYCLAAKFNLVKAIKKINYWLGVLYDFHIAILLCDKLEKRHFIRTNENIEKLIKLVNRAVQ